MESVRVTKSGVETGLKQGLECNEERSDMVVAEGMLKKLKVIEAWP